MKQRHVNVEYYYLNDNLCISAKTISMLLKDIFTESHFTSESSRAHIIRDTSNNKKTASEVIR